MLTLLFSVPFCLLVCYGLERTFPGRVLPNVSGWMGRIVGLLAVRMILLVGIGFLWEEWLAKRSLFRLAEVMNPMAAAFVAYVASTFVYYWWHRARHESKFLWRLFHQLHHSPRRIETLTAFYRHPLEIAVDGLIGACIVYSVFGLPLEAPIYYSVFGALGQFFIHMNVKTPRWVGFFIQRPEMHCLHHKRDRHTNNYSEIVWWDLLFGTYENPVEFRGACGFEPEQEQRLREMLAFLEVSRPGMAIREIRHIQPVEPTPPRATPRTFRLPLIELTLVGTILLMVAAIAIPCLTSARKAANEASAQQTIRNVGMAQKAYAEGPGKGNYASRLEDLADWLDPTVINSRKQPKSGYLFGEMRTTPKTATMPACFSIDIFPAQPRGIGRTGDRSFFIDETYEIRYAEGTARATTASPKIGE